MQNSTVLMSSPEYFRIEYSNFSEEKTKFQEEKDLLQEEMKNHADAKKTFYEVTVSNILKKHEK